MATNVGRRNTGQSDHLAEPFLQNTVNRRLVLLCSGQKCYGISSKIKINQYYFFPIRQPVLLGYIHIRQYYLPVTPYSH